MKMNIFKHIYFSATFPILYLKASNIFLITYFVMKYLVFPGALYALV